MEILGIDIGGSGIKGAPVNTVTGELLAERLRIPTPQPSTPAAVIDVIMQIVQHFKWKSPIGCGYPGVIKHGTIQTAANMDKSWVGYDLQQGLERLTETHVKVINDADAAGTAEMTFGAGRDHHDKMVMMITIGTGIGTAAFLNGKLIPNLELGHIEIDGKNAESRASDAAREREDLSWKKWAKRLDKYFSTIDFLMRPDLFIVGGGVSKRWDKVSEYLVNVKTPIVIAEFRNEAGIVGAALAAAHVGEIKS